MRPFFYAPTILVVHLYSWKIFAFQNQHHLKCSSANPIRCANIAGEWRAQDKYQMSFKYDKIGCKAGYQGSCDQLYYDAKAIGRKEIRQATEILTAQCSLNQEVCGVLARLYYEENEREKALSLDKKYFERFGKGIYPLEIYKDGKKAEAFALSLKSCEKEIEHCIFWVRYLPDHPQIGVLLARAELAAQKENGKTSGATTAAILGSYYYKRKSFDKAYSIWSAECEHHSATSCLLILGGDYPSPIKQNAYNNYCVGAGSIGEVNVEKLRSRACKEIRKDIPKEVLKSGARTLGSFLGEQV